MSVDNLSSFTYRAAVVAYAPIRRLIRPALSRRFPLRFCVRETLCTSWIPTMRLVAILMTLLAVGFASRAQASELTAAFEAACERTPDIPALAARRAEIGAKANAAEALLPGGPWATVLYRDDELTNDRGLREFRAEFDVPVWLRGERGAALASALTEGERLEAEITYRRLQVAKRVRDSYWAVEDARARIAVAERRRASASRLAQSQKGQTAAGQTELIESKLATAEARDADAELAGLRAELEEALIAFRVLTGVEPPRKFRELEAAMPPLHPRIDLRRRATEKAAADEALAWTVDRERPSVGVFSWNVDAPGLEPNANTIGVRRRQPAQTRRRRCRSRRGGGRAGAGRARDRWRDCANACASRRGAAPAGGAGGAPRRPSVGRRSDASSARSRPSATERSDPRQAAALRS